MMQHAFRHHNNYAGWKLIPLLDHAAYLILALSASGIAIFDDSDAQGHDAVVNEGPTFDSCSGHAGQFHGHSVNEGLVDNLGQGLADILAYFEVCLKYEFRAPDRMVWTKPDVAKHGLCWRWDEVFKRAAGSWPS